MEQLLYVKTTAICMKQQDLLAHACIAARVLSVLGVVLNDFVDVRAVVNPFDLLARGRLLTAAQSATYRAQACTQAGRTDLWFELTELVECIRHLQVVIQSSSLCQQGITAKRFWMRRFVGAFSKYSPGSL